MSTNPYLGLHTALVNLGLAAHIVIDGNGAVTHATPGVHRLLASDPTGTHFATLANRSTRPALQAYLDALASKATTSPSSYTTCTLRHGDGRPLWVQIQGVNALGIDPVDGLILLLTDISEHRHRELELSGLLLRDSLTGLSNRLHFMNRLRQLTERGACSAAMIDLDHFKQINDRFGHQLGDQALCTIGNRLVDALPATAVVARIGGEEFGVLLPGPVDDEVVAQFERVRRMASLPMNLAGSSVSVGMSIGITTAHAGSMDAALEQCDIAMYAAKMRGRAQVAVYDHTARETISNRRSLAARVDALLASNRKLQSEARTDALTGLLNRRALAEYEVIDVGQVDSPWSSCAVLFIDVDHFGRFNKLYGDHAGDLALKALADSLGQTARDSDMVFRKGGEEFVVLLPSSDLRTGTGVAERMRTAVEDLALAHAGGVGTGVVTVSITVASVAAGRCVGDAIVQAGNAAMAAKGADRRNLVNIVT